MSESLCLSVSICVCLSVCVCVSACECACLCLGVAYVYLILGMSQVVNSCFSICKCDNTWSLRCDDRKGTGARTRGLVTS